MSRPPFWRIPKNRKEEEEDFVAMPRMGYDNKLSHEEAIIMRKSGDAVNLQKNEAANSNTSNQQRTNPQTATLPRKVRETSEDRDKEVAIGHQPYRTTPLILPGAKVKREALLTQSYLQMQSSSKLWNSSTNQGNEQSTPVLGIHHQPAYSSVYKPKEKVFDPMKGWRSEPQQQAEAETNEAHGETKADQKENIEQSSKIENVQPKYYNPLESETFRALMETETAVPKKVVETKHEPQKVRVVPAAPFKNVNLMGLPQEKIQQSYSFRRLMNDVLGETDF